MFLGSIPPQMRSITREIILSWGVSDIWNPCSGNFTIARTLPELQHHGNDVTLYSSAMGAYFARQSIEVSLTEFGEENAPWLAPYLETPGALLATLMLGTRMFPSLGQTNVYHRRQVGAYEAQWKRLHEGTLAKIEATDLRLASFHARGAMELMRDDVPPDAAVVSYPPFMAGGYENLDKALRNVIEWQAPEYLLLGETEVRDLLDLICDREYWMIGVPQKVPELEENLRGVAQTTNRGVSIYMYASKGPTRAVAPRQRVKPIRNPRITLDTVLTGKERVSIARMDAAQFSALRSAYLSVKIAPALPTLMYAVLLDDTVVGAFGINKSQYGFNELYLLSDFPVSTSRYARLAALIPMIARSAEVKALTERQFSTRMTGISTTAFTNNQVSMKYRSAGYRLDKRSEGDNLHAYQLQYGASIGERTAQEWYEHWFRKHSKKLRSTS